MAKEIERKYLVKGDAWRKYQGTNRAHSHGGRESGNHR